MKLRFYYFLLIAILLPFFSSCKKKVSSDGWNDTLKTGIIRIASDESFKSMIDTEVFSFEAHHNFEAVVFPVYGNEDEVIRLLIEDSVRLAITSRDLTDAEMKELESYNRYRKKFLIAFEGITLITNTTNPDSLIGLPTLKKILTGEITEWSQINPDTHLGAIRVLFDNKDSGMLRYVIDSIAGAEISSNNLYALNNSLEVIEKVVEMPNTIGLVGANILSIEAEPKIRAMQKQVQMLRVSREEKPTLENSYLPFAGVIIQENYPLWRPVYALLTDPRSGLSSGFTIFLSHEVGQTIIMRSGLLPVTNPQARSLRIVESFPDENSKSRTIN